MKNEPYLFRGTQMERTDGGSGVIINHHAAVDCDPHAGCPFHAPSDHHMVDWPKTIFHGLSFRVCKHQQAHPDPDSVAFFSYMIPGPDYNEHGCDGCCKEPVEPVPPAEMAAARAGLEQLASSLEQLDAGPFYGRGTD